MRKPILAQFDVFNGDADGICSLIQMRLAHPCESTLVTGVKRDIALLDRVDAGDEDSVLVLDVSHDTNRAEVTRLLERGATIQYFDHHHAGELPEHERFSASISTAADTCTALLVDAHLDHAYRAWAVTAAFGDNLAERAKATASAAQLSSEQVNQLEMLGICINYNGYGKTPDDLWFHPADLFQRMVQFADPLDFLKDDRDTFPRLHNGYQEDLGKAQSAERISESPGSAALMLPDEPWSRRVSGIYANELANAAPDRAHAIITASADGTYLISVRAPLNRKAGAAELCMAFPTGGGRAAAAGINALPGDQLEAFLQALRDTYG